MRTWIVKANGDPDAAPLMIIRSYPNDGTISLGMPLSDPVVVTTRKVEEIRLALAAAIGDAQANAREDSRA